MLRLAVALNDPNKSLVSRIIHACTKSAAYHCELVFTDGRSLIVTPRYIGMGIRSYNFYNWTLVPIPGVDNVAEADIRQKCEDILATKPKYDWLGATSGFFGSKKEDSSKWFCSELIAYLLKPYIPTLNTNKWMTPDRLWKLISERIDNVYYYYLDR